MELEKELATKIINETKKMINENIIITNTCATIIASTDNERIGEFHEGAERTIRNKVITTITEDDEKTMEGVRAGINLPIIINESVVGMIGITGPPSKTKPFGSIIKKMTELLIKENVYIKEMEWKERVLEKFIFDWLNLDHITKEFIQKADVIGVNIFSKKRCILITIETEANSSLSMSSQLKKWLEQSIIGKSVIWGDNQLLILTELIKTEQINIITNRISEYVTKNLQTNILFGIGNIVESDLQRSYNAAERALKVATPENSIVFYENLLLELFLGDIGDDEKSIYLERTIGQIKSEPILLKTLKYYLQNNLNIKITAELLHIHINTLHYRLGKISELTKLNPKETESITAFYLALQILDDDTV